MRLLRQLWFVVCEGFAYWRLGTRGSTRCAVSSSLFRHARRKLGCLLLYGRTTPPESVTMRGGQVQVWNRGDRDEMFRIFDRCRDALVCGECGVPYAMPVALDDWNKKSPDRTFFCPNGHARHYAGKSDEQKLREAKEALARERASHGQTAASLKAQRGATTRAKNERDRIKSRVAHGVCPCCNRTFKQLSAHMQRKHPESEQSNEAVATVDPGSATASPTKGEV